MDHTQAVQQLQKPQQQQPPQQEREHQPNQGRQRQQRRQQQPQRQPQQWRQRQQKQQQLQQQLPPPRDTEKSCGVCPEDRPPCDHLLTYCSCCMTTSTLHSHYHKKHRTKSRSETSTSSQRRDSNGTKRPVEPPQLTPGGDLVATPHGQSVSGVTGLTSLKRCRLRASPATGLVGMQENVFLSEYFECLGFLPLTSESVMKSFVSDKALFRGESKRTFHSMDRSEVTGYLKLARDCLAECFDETTADTARAYLITSFLYRFLGDQENSRKYRAFAESLVRGLPQEEISSDMENLLLTHGYATTFIHYCCSGWSVGVKAKKKPERYNQIPKAKSIVREKDLYNFYIIAEQKMHRAFLEEVRSEVNMANIKGETERALDRGVDGDSGEYQNQGTRGTRKETGGWEEAGLAGPLKTSDLGHDSVKGGGYQSAPTSGGAIQTCIRDVLPGMTSRLAVLERSGTCSGVATLGFHGSVALMKAVEGKMHSSFQSMKVCAEVLMRFPGLCRYRPHLVHAMLTAAASSMRRDVYDPVREIYNSILPWNSTPAPPMEEWGGMNSMCNNVFCRSFLAETSDMDYGSNNMGFDVARAVAASAPSIHSSDVQTSPITGETHRSPHCGRCGVQPWTASMGAVGTIAASQLRTGMSLPSPTFLQASPQDKGGMSADNGVETDAGSQATVEEVATLAAVSDEGILRA